MLQPCVPASPLTLDQLKAGEHAFFLTSQNDRAVVCRLTSLGFTPGVDIEMTQNYGHGPLVVMVRATRVALGRQEARNTWVQRGKI